MPVGYADGYRRALSNKGQVLVCGQRAPVLGRICMDHFMVDITEIPQAEIGAEVVLLGSPVSYTHLHLYPHQHGR